MNDSDEHARRFREAVHQMATNKPHDDASTSQASVGSVEVKSLMNRYWDAYTVARVIVGYANLIKIVGVVLAAVILLISLLVASQFQGGGAFAMFLVGLLNAAVVGILFYSVGILVAAQGEMLKATLDGAVNGSPFLTNEHRAKIMSLK